MSRYESMREVKIYDAALCIHKFKDTQYPCDSSLAPLCSNFMIKYSVLTFLNVKVNVHLQNSMRID